MVLIRTCSLKENDTDVKNHGKGLLIYLQVFVYCQITSKRTFKLGYVGQSDLIIINFIVIRIQY